MYSISYVCVLYGACTVCALINYILCCDFGKPSWVVQLRSELGLLNQAYTVS